MFNKLKQWREDRKISGYDHKIQVSNIVEEMLETMYMPKCSLIKQYKEEIVGKYFVDDTTNNEKVDSFADLIVFSVNAIELLGYDAEKCMDETIKEISSRRQSPIQKDIWDKWGYDNTKWEKDKNQPRDTLYVADYDGCKR